MYLYYGIRTTSRQEFAGEIKLIRIKHLPDYCSIAQPELLTFFLTGYKNKL